MQRQAPTRPPSHIRFIKNLATSRPPQPAKSHSTAALVSRPAPHCPTPFALHLNLLLPNHSQHSLVYHFAQTGKVHELIAHLREQLGLTHVYFTSGNVLLDYFLTLGGRNLAELATSRLNLQVREVSVQEQVDFKAIEVIKCIGVGGFSKVVLARVYGLTMAVKLINKEFIKRTAKESLIENEKTILQICEGHPFITKLFFAFESHSYVVFGMEYCNGGELFNLLRRVRKMKETEARFYFMETLMAIEFLHSQGIIYRDLKPENIIIDADGHLRLADFGLSKIVNRQVTYSFCGSAEYISPEMLLKKGHTYQIDFYCLGALVYELVTGLPPFYTHNQDELFNKILNNELTFPDHANISQELKNFLSKMLQKRPEDRFQTVQQIVGDPWVSSQFDRTIVMSKKLVPPFPTAVFAFNFDDSEFRSQQADLHAQLEKQKLYDGTVSSVFQDFYYESQEIVHIKDEVLNSNKQDFSKNKTSANNFVYQGVRKISIQDRRLSLSRNEPRLSIGNTLKISSKTPTGSNPVLVYPDLSKAKSTQNLKQDIKSTPYLLPGETPNQKKTINSLNFYMSKSKLVPSSSLGKLKLSNQLYTQCLDHSLEKSINNSLSRESSIRTSSKDKSSSLDKHYFSYKREDCRQGPQNKQYLNYYRDKFPNPKVKKSAKGTDKVSFQYASLHRM